jgi:hypothetical protein
MDLLRKSWRGVLTYLGEHYIADSRSRLDLVEAGPPVQVEIPIWMAPARGRDELTCGATGAISSRRRAVWLQKPSGRGAGASIGQGHERERNHLRPHWHQRAPLCPALSLEAMRALQAITEILQRVVL